MKNRMVVLTTTYRTRADSVTLELYGKTPDNESVVLMYDGFKPYCYMVARDSSIRETLERKSEVLWVEETELEHEHQQVPVFKIFVKYPQFVAQLRREMPQETFFSGDILFTNRFLYDLDLGAYVEYEGVEEGNHIKISSIKRCDPFKTKLRYLSFDIENSLRDGSLYVIGYSTFDEAQPENARVGHILGDSDKEMIEMLGALIKAYNPDILTGFNIEGYDIPHLEKRANLCDSGLFWGRDGGRPRSNPRRGGSAGASDSEHYRMNGRVVYDAMFYAKKELTPQRHNLNFIAELVLGEKKDDIDAQKIDEEWDTRKAEIIKYCEKDADLALKILLNIRSVRKSLDLATVAYLPLDEIAIEKSSAIVDSRLIRLADKVGFAVPLTRRKDPTAPPEEKIKGAHIMEMRAGLHQMVPVLDFKSMYPTTIIKNNISPDTYHPDGAIISPTGARYLLPEEKKGLIPRILEELLEERDDVKARMKNAGDSEKQYLDGLQNALKIVMNSFYGIVTASFYRFSNKEIGESVTGFSRQSIRKAIEILRKKDIDVIYGDTDSVFYISPTPDDLEETVRLGEEIARDFTEGGLTLEFEKIFDPMFSHGAKKRYFGKIVWPYETDDIFVRGYETRRTDAFPLQTRSLLEVMDHVVNRDEKGATKCAREAMASIRDKVAPIEDFIISKTAKKESDYVNPDSMANIKAVRLIRERGYEFLDGTKVSWVVIDGSTPQQVEPVIPGVEINVVPDWSYYSRRLSETLGRITGVFGWTPDDLYYDSRQTRFGDTPFSVRKRRRKIELASEGLESPSLFEF